MNRKLMFVLVGSALSFGAVASGDTYVGVTWGEASWDSGVSGVTGTASLDESDTGFGLIGGIELNDNVDIEAHYQDFGEVSLKGNNGDTFVYGGTTYTFTANNVNVKYEGTSYGVSGIFSQPINSQASVYGKLGLHHWDVDASATSSAGNASISDDGTDLLYGVGLGYKISEDTALRLDLTRIEFGDEDVDYVGAGVTRSF